MDRSFSATLAYGLKMEKFLQTIFACVLLLSIVQVNGFSKYGRTCRDIGCRQKEKCTMVEECDDSGKCGYPTCVKDNSIERYDSAGVSIVNGHRTHNNNNNQASVSTNTNPYANANAPPIDDTGRNNPVSSGTNYGYPAYPSPSNNNNNNGHFGSYSPPSSSGTNLGYPPYPTQNRMPMPGQTGVYQQPPPPPAAGGFYPGNSASGYPPYPTNQQYPSHSNYPYQTRNYNSNAHYPRFRNTSSRTMCSQIYHVLFAALALAIATIQLS